MARARGTAGRRARWAGRWRARYARPLTAASGSGRNEADDARSPARRPDPLGVPARRSDPGAPVVVRIGVGTPALRGPAGADRAGLGSRQSGRAGRADATGRRAATGPRSPR